MKRLVITGPRAAEFEDVPPPLCPDEGLLVRAEVTAISTGTEIRAYRSIPVDEEGLVLYPSVWQARKVPLSFPYENGYSMVGRVAEVGRSVDGFSEGDRVFVGEPHKEYAAVSAELAVKLPDGVLTELAVFLNVLGVGQLGLRKGSPAPGENVAVVGLGVIGLATVALSKSFRFRVLGIDTDGQRLEVARKMGIEAVSPEDGSFDQRVLDWSDGRGADVVVEAASTWRATRTAMDVARQGGTVVIVATHTDKPEFSPVSHPYLGKNLKLLTSLGYTDPRWDRTRSSQLMLDMLESGDLKIAPMITHEFEWSEILDVYRRLDEGDSELLGVVFRWPSGPG